MKHLLALLSLCLVGFSFLFAQEQGQSMGLAVADAKLGSNVQDHEIVGESSSFNVNDRVYLWLKVTGGKDDSVMVTWKTGDLSYSTTLRVGGSPWRTWAYKTAYVAGDWTATVTDATSGAVLKEMSFKVSPLEKN